ncbi:MAG: ribosome maturation factor RimM [Spirochaetales bacterium]|nr:ribosome maturation factor RimM [Spirochaetales bacterium]MCF7937439.1 ribosome maturation factor RimM [Spirochaetales bacterium]
MLPEKLTVAVLGKRSGIEGDIKVRSLSGELEHLETIREAELVRGNRQVRVTVERTIRHGDQLLMKFAGVDSPEEAARLTGMEMQVERGQAAKLGPDEYYHADLCQCSVYFEQKCVGTVKSIVFGPENDLLEVQGEESVYLIPFRKEFIGEISVDSRRIELLEEWILE